MPSKRQNQHPDFRPRSRSTCKEDRTGRLVGRIVPGGLRVALVRRGDVETVATNFFNRRKGDRPSDRTPTPRANVKAKISTLLATSCHRETGWSRVNAKRIPKEVEHIKAVADSTQSYYIIPRQENAATVDAPEQDFDRRERLTDQTNENHSHTNRARVIRDPRREAEPELSGQR